MCDILPKDCDIRLSLIHILANKITPKTSVQNISQKMKRDNFSEKELQAIAAACDATFEANFILNDTGKVI